MTKNINLLDNILIKQSDSLNLLTMNIDKLIKMSNYKILDFKSDLEKIYNIVFKYCSCHDVLIYNPNINISKINNTNYDMSDIQTDFIFNIFSQTPKIHAHELLDIIYNNYSKYVTLTSYINNNEIILTIDNNKLIYFNLLLSSNISFFDCFKYIDFKYNDYNLKIVPNELTLMFLLHKLYSPSIFLNTIKDDNYYLSKFKTIISQFDSNNKLTIINKYSKNNNKQTILKEFYNTISSMDLDIILLDSYALTILKSKKIDSFNETLNFITNIKNNVIKLFVTIINDILKNNNIEYSRVIYNFSNTYIYNDFRLKKVNIFVILKDNTKLSLMNIFNSIEYEVIPVVYNIKNIYIPHYFIIIRFMLFNLISIQLYDKKIKQNTIDKYKSDILNIYNLNLTYNNITYKGIYKDEKIDKFNMGTNTFRPKLKEQIIQIDEDDL